MLPQIVVQCENSSDRMLPQIGVQCENSSDRMLPQIGVQCENSSDRMLPQIGVQCENSSDPMTLKIVQCELGITEMTVHKDAKMMELKLKYTLNSINQSNVIFYFKILKFKILINTIIYK